MVHNYSGLYFSILGSYAEALAHIEQALTIARNRRDRMSEASAYAASASALLLMGDLAGVRNAVAALQALPTDSGIMAAHGCAWGTLAGIYLGDDALIAHWFDRFEARLPSFGASIYAAGCAQILVARGRDTEARALLHRAIDYGEVPRGIVFTLLAVARFGDPDDFAQARANLSLGAATQANVVERPALDLFDAYVAKRRGDTIRAAERAAAAADGFKKFGCPLLEGRARSCRRSASSSRHLSTPGRARRRAKVAFLSENVARHVTGVATMARGRRPEGEIPEALSPREHEIATLVADGNSNLKIAQALSISQKTVEAHLGSAFRKLGVSSRTQLVCHLVERSTPLS